MDPRVSVVMTAYRRASQLKRTLESLAVQDQTLPFEVLVVEDGYDGGETESVCRLFGFVRYFCRRDRPDRSWSNPAVPNNIGIKQALGDVVILQNAENMWIARDGVRRLGEAVLAAPTTCHLGAVASVDQQDKFLCWYLHPVLKPRPFFFCQALHRSVLLELRGFDEDFTASGFEDDDLARRLTAHGVSFVFHGEHEVLLHHQWHDNFHDSAMTNEALYEAKRDAGIVRNVGREWGVLV